MPTHGQKITFGEMRESGVHGVLIYCSGYRCSHSIKAIADGWTDELMLSDIENRFVCQKCGRRGADIRPHFNWDRTVPAGGMGYRNT
jgi:hypothetical protein